MSRLDVRRIRTELGLTQAELAEQLGVHLRSIVRWEAKEGAAPSPLAVAKLREVVGKHRKKDSTDDTPTDNALTRAATGTRGLLPSMS